MFVVKTPEYIFFIVCYVNMSHLQTCRAVGATKIIQMKMCVLAALHLFSLEEAERL